MSAYPNLSIGPLQYYWPKAQMKAFYQQAAQSHAHVIYLGETVCSKRREFSGQDYLEQAMMLRESGKQAVLSTMTLLEQQADLHQLRRIIDNGEFLVEANDMGAVAWLAERRLPFVGGSALNIYNEQALRLIVCQGMVRWVPPVELSRDWLLALLEQPCLQSLRSQLEIEIFGYGHLPLAWSGRCFTARSENRGKDQCQLCCIQYPKGRLAQSQHGQRLFLLNGIQTQSGDCYNLQNDIDSMAGWVHYVRLSPDHQQFFQQVEQFATRTPRALEPHEVNGYWHQLAGFRRHQESIE